MTNVLEYLESSAKSVPNKIAVTDGLHQYSFTAMQDYVQRIGSALVTKISTGSPVAVMMEKSADALCAFLGIVSAGGFYVFLNAELPDVRLQQITQVLQTKYVITDESHRMTAQRHFAKESVFMVNDLMHTPVNAEALKQRRNQMIDTDPLYANFTSGSTGVPKGVVVSHRSVIDFINVFTELFDFSEEDVIANQAPFDFDVSVKDIYSSLKMASTLVIVPRALFSRPKQLLDFICEHRTTTMIWAVSALCLISTFHGLDYRVPTTVQKVLFSGEVMPMKQLREWMEHLPKALFVNLYGPTEITCNCTYHILDRNRTYDTAIPIGRPFPNEDVFLLDEGNQKIVEADTPGEICVRGSALALGYYRAAEQTNRAFVQNPLQSCYPEMIYRTGDLGKYSENGELFFCGRKDFQIKHMGHRIELEEIERTISSFPEIERCCCVFEEEKQRLYAFYIGDLPSKELHLRLRKILPIYMIPASFYSLMEFPLTKNGKIDRKQLLERRTKK